MGHELSSELEKSCESDDFESVTSNSLKVLWLLLQFRFIVTHLLSEIHTNNSNWRTTVDQNVRYVDAINFVRQSRACDAVRREKLCAKRQECC